LGIKSQVATLEPRMTNRTSRSRHDADLQASIGAEEEINKRGGQRIAKGEELGDRGPGPTGSPMSRAILLVVCTTSVFTGQDAHGRGRNHSDGDEHREGDGGTDGDGDVAEQLASLFAYEKDGNEYGQVSKRGVQEGAPDFAGAFDGGGFGILAELVAAKDVFEHHDGIIDEHADGEGEAAEGRHVE
jgi:hypothetical protein